MCIMLMTEAAKARPAASACRTDEASCIVALMKRLRGGDKSVLTMNMPIPACLVPTPCRSGEIDASEAAQRRREFDKIPVRHLCGGLNLVQSWRRVHNWVVQCPHGSHLAWHHLSCILLVTLLECLCIIIHVGLRRLVYLK